jgi:hypothetical protein
MLQSPLIQDGALDSENKRVGRNIRMLEVTLAVGGGGATQEMVYRLDGPSLGVNELLAVDDHEFLAIERDGKGGDEAKVKRIVKIDTVGASDVSAVDALPGGELPAGIVPVAKAAFADLLDAKFGLAGAAFPEKIEGLAFGPDLPDGRHVLLVTSDNDFRSDQPTYIYMFAVDAADLPGFTGQRVEAGGAGASGADQPGSGER